MKYDTVIVGAGSAGGILATRLSEDPGRSVLLLEAGPDHPDFERLPDELKYGYGSKFGYTAQAVVGGTHDWDFTGRATDKAPAVAVPAGKVVGGTSAINARSVGIQRRPSDPLLADTLPVLLAELNGSRTRHPSWRSGRCIARSGKLWPPCSLKGNSGSYSGIRATGCRSNCGPRVGPWKGDEHGEQERDCADGPPHASCRFWGHA